MTSSTPLDPDHESLWPTATEARTDDSVGLARGSEGAEGDTATITISRHRPFAGQRRGPIADAVAI